ncbi:MAG: DUF2842 domain-containing protein [Paracoccus sp. (in: a-proteobacteria)]|nr:DUF2842 domain-containing protein [Paracoccus sp. (in: a-proteobacteria)]
MDHRRKKRLSLLVFLVVMPLYIIAVWWLLTWLDDRFGRLPMLLELAIYVVAGIAWIFPFKGLFTGIGRDE